MDEKYVQLLETIATKLGVTAEYLWGVLVRQAPISALTELATFCVLWVAIAIAWRFVLRIDGKPFDSPKEIAIVAAVVSTAALALITAMSAGDIVNGLVSPEYWALRQLPPK